MTDTFDVLIAAISIVCGCYCLYAYLEMKKTNEINTTILLGKTVDPKKCKDKNGYLACMMPKVFVLGAALVVYGAIDLLNTYILKNNLIVLIAIGILTVILFWFAYHLSKTTKKYF